jgi:short-subunit dehydrogenase
VSATLRCNLDAPLRLTALVLPSMLRRRAGLILNVSSACAAPVRAPWHARADSL